MVVIQFILQAGNIMSIGFEKAYALQTDLNMQTSEIIATYVYKRGLDRRRLQFLDGSRPVQHGGQRPSC